MGIIKQSLPTCICIQNVYVDLIGQLSAYGFQLYQQIQVNLIG